MNTQKIKWFLLFAVAAATAPAWGDWKTEADARIENIRKRDVQITVVDAGGYPVSDVNVQIEQIRHRFAFGSEIDNDLVNDVNNMDNPDYTDFFKDHFEWAVMGNESKWYSNEPYEGYVTYEDADTIYNWCADNGITMRGHCIYWEQDGAYQQQQWVEELEYAPLPAESELRTAVENRMDSAVNHFKGKFVHWDVDNEMLPTPHFYQSRLGQGIWYWMFQAANEIDPDCKLFTNEYSGNSFGGYNAQPYINLVNDLRNNSAPVHGIGIQGHVSPTFNPTSYWNYVLKPLGTLGLPIWVTEFDYEEPNDTFRADGLEDFYRICFSDPNVEGILMWGFWENCHWRPDWWIVNSDWTLNEAGVRYEALMSEWTTNDSNTTDYWGIVYFRGFHGTYRISLTVPGVTTEVKTIELEPADTPAEFVLRLGSFGQPSIYNIVRSTIDGGGGTSSGGQYIVRGTIGQHDAAYSQGGDYELLGGFWPGEPLCIVEFEDFARFAQYWLQTGPGLSADLYEDNTVDYLDLEAFVYEWLYYCPYDWPLK
jgi:endo-1,4-beta-xylanase